MINVGLYYRVKEGHEKEFEEIFKKVVETLKSANVGFIDADSSPPHRGEGSSVSGSSFPPSIRDYISHLVGSRGSQRAHHLKRGNFHC
ncbi:antibiotic biosynthesis monooxygenase family protein [Acidianus ambivalens]|uniref:antibiotic biosynthesis monooxygenase family protein n=1 Tax=Acidianus ambivalens TaxID=2283 RepID=UPI001E28A64D|nr:antibiotic biosynthesis monooxygenase [Acidianus ambivalens]